MNIVLDVLMIDHPTDISKDCHQTSQIFAQVAVVLNLTGQNGPQNGRNFCGSRSPCWQRWTDVTQLHSTSVSNSDKYKLTRALILNEWRIARLSKLIFYNIQNYFAFKTEIWCLLNMNIYHLWSLWAVRLYIIIISLWNLTISVALLLRCLSNFRAIGKV